MKEIKWEQWSPNEGLIRCGFNDLKTLMEWMRELGKDAKKCLSRHHGKHAVYGRKIYNDDDSVKEIRFYCDTYMTDDELDEMIMNNPRDIFYIVHKDGTLN